MEISVTFGKGKIVRANFDTHTVETDQPVGAGGTNSAPSPFDLFLASIATCSGYYVLDFCASRTIPTDEVNLSLRTNRDAASRMIDRVEITISVPPSFPKRYEKAVVRAAELCTVKKHLINPPAFETTVRRA